VDAAVEAGGNVNVRRQRNGSYVELLVEDDGRLDIRLR
jgi:hypothetical protein